MWTHWGIENRLHGTRDLAFSEDKCSIWQNREPENQATLRKIALDLLRLEKRRKRGLKAKSAMASEDNDYFLRILLQKN